MSGIVYQDTNMLIARHMFDDMFDTISTHVRHMFDTISTQSR